MTPRAAQAKVIYLTGCVIADRVMCDAEAGSSAHAQPLSSLCVGELASGYERNSGSKYWETYVSFD